MKKHIMVNLTLHTDFRFKVHKIAQSIKIKLVIIFYTMDKIELKII